MRFFTLFSITAAVLALTACSTPLPPGTSMSKQAPTAANGTGVLSILPEPSKETCAALPAGAHPLNPQLCVTGGAFAHDVYVLKLDGRIVLKGIDDQTTFGIEARHADRLIGLRCIPQNVFPKGNREENLKEVRRILPNATQDEVTRVADLLEPGPMGMELARACTATSDGTTILEAQVVFQ